MVNPVNLAGYANVLGGLEELADQFSGDVVYVVGTNTKYAVHLEFGTRKMQQYPWFRPAVREFNKNPERFISKHTSKSIDDLDGEDEVAKTIAGALEKRLKQNVSAGDVSGRSPDVEPGHPKVQTNNLRASIEAEKVR